MAAQNASDRFVNTADDTVHVVPTQAGRTISSGNAPPTQAQSVIKGDAATARLKEAGHYDSLMQAMQTARYAVESVEAVPATGKGGGCYAANPAHALRC